MFCSRYLPFFGKPLSRIFVTMILRPFFMVYSNDDSHKTRINKFSTNNMCKTIPNYGKIHHITMLLNMICILAERLLYNHLLSRILDILALKKSKTK